MLMSTSLQKGSIPPQATVESLEQTLADLFESREEHQAVRVKFSKNEKFTRTDVTRLEVVIGALDAVKDIDSQIVKIQLKWTNLKLKKGEDVKDHEYADEKFEPKMDEFGSVCDKVRTKFVEMLETFNDNAEVRDLLKNFLPKEARKDNGANSFDGYSSVSGKGAEYVKTKLPKIKN